MTNTLGRCSECGDEYPCVVHDSRVFRGDGPGPAADDDIYAVVRERDAALADVARLRAALEEYAEPYLWASYLPDRPKDAQCFFLRSGNGYDVARAALAGTEAPV